MSVLTIKKEPLLPRLNNYLINVDMFIIMKSNIDIIKTLIATDLFFNNINDFPFQTEIKSFVSKQKPFFNFFCTGKYYNMIY